MPNTFKTTANELNSILLAVTAMAYIL